MTGTGTGRPWPGRPIPGNRWDELAESWPDPLPTVTVVVPYYDQQDQLDLVLDALRRQDYPSGSFEVVVADDGSPRRPHLPDGVGYVRQDDRGFRAAAARNLGARASRSEVLAFLDADTVPQTDYLRHAARLPALAPEAVVVGRRRYAHLTGPDADPQAALPEPGWLRQAYADTRDLLDADDHCYRYVLSAVLTCSRAFFEEIGGFDETLVGYGGEDWELAHRAWRCGALLAHVPEAVAWHDGPAFDERARHDPEAAREAKNAEALALAERIRLPGSRPSGVVHADPDLLVRVGGGGPVPAVVVTTLAVLRTCDAHVVLPCPVPPVLRGDPRVLGPGARPGTRPGRGAGASAGAGAGVVGRGRGSDVGPRAEVVLDAGVAPEPGAIEAALARMHAEGLWGAALTSGGKVIGRITTARGAARRRRWGGRVRDGEGSVELACRVVARPDLEAVFGGWDGAEDRFGG